MIRVSEPLLAGNEKKYVLEALDAGEISSGGRFVRQFEEAFAKWSGNKYAVAVSSGTAALETAIWSLGINEISIPAGTIISCYIAAIRAGARVVFRDNGNGAGGSHIMRCHLFGERENLQLFNPIGDPFLADLKAVDDCSQYWVPFRTDGVACYSLYANKLITAGEGGVIVTNDEAVYRLARSYRDLCHSEERFVHKHLGYNFRISNLQAAVALAQLEQIDRFTEIKQRNRDLYLKYLPEQAQCLFKVDVPWMYLVKTHYDAGEVVQEMRNEAVECRRFFYPLHRQPCIKAGGLYPNADSLWNHAFYLPSGLSLTEKEIAYVCERLRSVLRSI